MKRHYAPFYFLLMLLVGCATLGLPVAQTFNQKLAVGYATVTGIVTTADNLLLAKAITPDDAVNVLQQADNAKAGLDIAKKISTTDMTAADAKLTATRALLTAINSYLMTKQGGVK